jgi:hypothetical protein
LVSTDSSDFMPVEPRLEGVDFGFAAVAVASICGKGGLDL